MRRWILCLVVVLPLLSPRAPTVGAEEDGAPAPAAAAEERAAIKKMVDELRAVASEIRGLEWKHDVPADLLTRSQLREKLKEMIAEEVELDELARDTKILRRIGLLGPDQDPLQMQLEMLKEMVAGYYNPKKKRLFLISGLTGEAQKPVILHELIHALEDQHYDLQKREEPFKEDSDRSFVERALFEGSAEIARVLYENENPAVAYKFLEGQSKNQEQAEGQARVLRSTPAFLLLGTLLHYRVGPHFVRQYIEGDYQGRMALLYENGPTTQEQMLHPERWLGTKKDLPRKVVWNKDFAECAGEGWTRVHDMVLGELDLAMYLDFFLGPDDGKLSPQHIQLGTFVDERAHTAAHGWDAARAYYMEKEGLPMAVLMALAFDTAKDADEAAKAFAEAFRVQNGDQWKAEDWADVNVERIGPTEVVTDAYRHLQYASAHGHGVILVHEDKVFIADGLPEDLRERMITELFQTTFEKLPGDTWAAVEDPFAGYDLVDRRRGVGVKTPNEGWRIDAVPGMAKQQDPSLLAVLSKDGVQLIVGARDQGLSQAALPAILQIQMKQMGLKLGADDIQKAEVGGLPGVFARLPSPPGMTRRIYLGSDAVRTLQVILMGPTAAVEASTAEIAAALAGIKSIPTY